MLGDVLWAGYAGFQISQGVWYAMEVIEPSVIYEVKDGKCGENGSEMYGG